jgi:hypothetical protein
MPQIQLVTLAAAKAQLSMDHDSDDSLIYIFIEAASSAVLNYLNRSDAAEYLDTSDEVDLETVEPEVKQAVLLLVNYFYNDRGGDDPGAYEHGYLPTPVIALLYPLRDPTSA